jgi:hypothetical protein
MAAFIEAEETKIIVTHNQQLLVQSELVKINGYVIMPNNR